MFSSNLFSRSFVINSSTANHQVPFTVRALVKVGERLRPLELRGVARVLSALAPWGLGRRARLLPTVGGNRLVIDPTSYFDVMMFFGRYAEPVLRVIDVLVKPGDVAVDVGAQLGFVSNHLAERVGADGRVVSFEPDPAALDRLETGLRANGYGWVTVVPCAAGAEESTLAFNLSPVLGWSTAVHGTHLSGLRTVQVRVRRVDDVLDELGRLRPALIKVDVEGYEAAVISGLTRTLESSRPFLLLEVLPNMLEKSGTSDEELLSDLRRKNYSITWLSSRREGWGRRIVFEPHVPGQGRHGDVFAVPTERLHEVVEAFGESCCPGGVFS